MSNRTFSATRWAAITPSDSDTIEPFPVAVYCGGDGDVVASGEDGTQATFAVSAGQTLLIQPLRILATGTTATGLIALYN